MAKDTLATNHSLTLPPCLLYHHRSLFCIRSNCSSNGSHVPRNLIFLLRSARHDVYPMDGSFLLTCLCYGCSRLVTCLGRFSSNPHKPWVCNWWLDRWSSTYQSWWFILVVSLWLLIKEDKLLIFPKIDHR